MNPTSGDQPGNTHEDLELQLLHEEALGHWTTPVPDFERIRERYTRAIREREKKTLWGYKDPRLNFLIPWVLRIIRCNVKVVVVYRNTLCAARSIVRVTDIELEEAKRITAAYGEARLNAIRYIAKRYYMYPLFYDDLVNRPKVQIPMLATFVGVTVTQEAVDFVDPDLRHFK